MKKFLTAAVFALLCATPSFADDPRITRIVDVLDKMDQRMDRIEARVAHVEGKLSALESRYSAPSYSPPSYSPPVAYRPPAPAYRQPSYTSASYRPPYRSSSAECDEQVERALRMAAQFLGEE